MKNPWKKISSKEIYDNPWIKVREDQVITPGGSNGIYGVVEFKNHAIGILPLDDDNNTWLVGQYRYALDIYSWEIPMGGGPINSSALDSAKRELLEETGIQAKEWKEFLRIHTSNSVTDELGIVYTAKKLKFGIAQPEDTEELFVKKLPLHEAVEMAYNGEITDSVSLATLLKAKQLL